MSRSTRFTLIAVAVVAVAVAFVALQPDDDEDSAQQPAGAARAEATGTAPDGRTTPSEAEPAPERPEVQRIAVRDGQPVGGLAEIEAEKGDTVRFTVTSDAPHEVHLHGYDISKDVARGGPARFRFEASIDGIYEIELEDTATPIAELRVEP